MSEPDEKAWLVVYGIASALYRLFIGLVIALYLAGKFFAVGLLLAGWFLCLQVLQPAWRNLRSLWRSARQESRTAQVGWRLAGLLLAVWLLLFQLPISQSTHALGVIRVPEQAEIRVASEGFVEQVLVNSDTEVDAGQVLLQLSNPGLEKELTRLQARERELQASYRRASETNRVDAAILLQQLQLLNRELRDLREQHQQLLIPSPVAGRVQLPGLQDLAGRFLHKGSLLGYVDTGSLDRARVVIGQRDIQRVRERIESVQARLFSTPGEVLKASLVRATPSALELLPSPVLGTAGGGQIRVDLNDPRGLTPLQPVFELEIQLHDMPHATFPGSRVAVRFVHASAPLASRLATRWQQWHLASPLANYDLH